MPSPSISPGNGKKLRIHDTAGLRRRSRIDEKLEKLSVADTLNAVRFAEVVIVLIDAQAPFEEQDTRIADLVEREGRAIVIAVNKWDTVEAEPGALSRLRASVDRMLPQIKGVPVAVLSAKTGNGLDKLMDAVMKAYAVWNRRLPTAALNRFLRRGDLGQSAARDQRPQIPPRLHHAAEIAAADFRAVLRARGSAAGNLSPLSDQRTAREFRSARYTDPARAAGQGQSVRQEEAADDNRASGGAFIQAARRKRVPAQT